MKPSNKEIVFFLLSLSLTTETNVWAKLRSNTEEHRELNHKSRNYYQSKLKNGFSGKCIGFDVVNDVDDGDLARWVNCKRAPTFEFMNEQYNDTVYFNHDKRREYITGYPYKLTFQVGSLSESSSTSDPRRYMCLEGDLKKGVIAKECKITESAQNWMPVAVRNQRDTWRLKNSKLKLLIKYILKPIDSKDQLDFAVLNAEAKEQFGDIFIDTFDFFNALKENHGRHLSSEETLKIVNSVNPRLFKPDVTIDQLDTSSDPDFSESIVTPQVSKVSEGVPKISSDPDFSESIVTPQVSKLLEEVLKMPEAAQRLKSLATGGKVGVLSSLPKMPADAQKMESLVTGRAGDKGPLAGIEAIVSMNGTIVDFSNEAQYFVDLDCRFVFGKDPVRNDGWYNGRDADSTKPPESDS